MKAQDAILLKLRNVLGEERAGKLVDETMQRLGVRALDTPSARLRFAEAIIPMGGVIEAIGRAAKVHALLHGAEQHSSLPDRT